jgi:hypothetical protein
MNIETLTSPLSTVSDGKNSLKISTKIIYLLLEIEPYNTTIPNDKIESSEPCWDGYQVNK